MRQPYYEESIVKQYKYVIEKNKAIRMASGNVQENEPAELIFDEQSEADIDILPWEFTNLISDYCLWDIFGGDFFAYKRLLDVELGEMVMVEGNIYYREQYVRKVLNTLETLAKSQFVNQLRPIPQIVKGSSTPVYNNEDMMRILGVNDATLRKLRNDGWLSHTHVNGSNKFWYTEQNLMDFLNNPSIHYKSWR